MTLPRSISWRVDETYVNVGGKWAYLYRAVDEHGNTIDFYLSPTCNTAAAKRVLSKALNGLKEWGSPTVINTDEAPTYGPILAELKAEGKCPEEIEHRHVKISEQRGGGRLWQAEAANPPGARFQDLEDGLRDDQGI